MAHIPIRLTRIVATLGPSTSDETVLRRMIDAGMDVARLNFAHGTHATHGDLLARLRRTAEASGRFVAVLQDLAGPKLRVRTKADQPVEVHAGDRIHLCRDLQECDEPRAIACTYPDLVDDCAPDDPVLFADGDVLMRVAERTDEHLVLDCADDGTLCPGAGINLPQTDLGTSLPTEQDWRDLAWGLEHEVDYVGLSFVRTADEVRCVKEHLAKAASNARVIAKIEKPQAVDAIEPILAECDALMVARGDLGVEMDVARVPIIQKDLIRRAAAAGVPVITATQMLQSMVNEPRPTRAEVSDVANAVFDGSDAVMLSGETAVGRHPVRAVEMMDHIIDLAEDYAERADWQAPAARPERFVWSERAIVAGATGIARNLDPAVIVALTHTGATALLVSKQWLRVPILAVSDSVATCRRMALYRGVMPVHSPDLIRQERLAAAVERMARQRKLVVPGDRILIISGYFPGKPGGTDTLRVHTVSGGEAS
jgi:pyruvate kinase